MSDGGGKLAILGPYWDNTNSLIHTSIYIYAFNTGGTFSSAKNFWSNEDKSTAVTSRQGDTTGTVDGYFDNSLYDIEIRESDNTTVIKRYTNVRFTGDDHILDSGAAYPSAAAANIEHLAVKRTAGGVFDELGLNNATAFKTLIKKSADDAAHIFDDVITGGPARDPRIDGAVGDGVTDDKSALDITFSNPTIAFPEGTFMAYDLSLSGVNSVTGLGYGSVVKCNNLAADYVIGFQGSGQSTLIIDKLVVDGNKSLGTFTGSGHGVDIRGYDQVYIGWLEIKNAWGHGLVIADCDKVNIGTLIVHDNHKYGATFDSNNDVGAAENITIDTLYAYDNGADVGGVGSGNDWSGINFSDLTSSNTGSRRVVIGKVIAHGNARNGLSLGRNATSNDTGPSEFVIGEMLLYSNFNYGVEMFGAHNVGVASIIAHSNALSGVGILHGDLSPGPEAYCENISIGDIVSYNNDLHGVEITGGKKVHIDSIIAYNNSQDTVVTSSGLSINETGVPSGSSINTDIVIDKLHAYDDQGTATQLYGLEVKQTVSDGRNYIRHFTASGNSAGDYNLTWPGALFNAINLNGKWHSYITTPDATADVIALKSNVMPDDSLWLARGVAVGAKDTNGTVRGVYHFEQVFWKDGAGAVVTMGSETVLHSTETDAGLNATFGVSGTDRVGIFVTGIAATSMLWKVYLEIEELSAY